MPEDDDFSPLITFAVVVFVGIFAVLFLLFFVGPDRRISDSMLPLQEETEEGGSSSGELKVTNHLKVPVRVYVLPRGTVMGYSSPQLKAKIEPGKSQHISCNGERRIRVVLDSTDQIFGEYSLVQEDNKASLPPELHIGIVTSQWVGADSDYNIGKSGLNAVQGVPWLYIHNLSNVPLKLNRWIEIPPESVFRFKGRDHFGVRLGTVFKDDDGKYPDFIFSIPATDLYYGHVSERDYSEFNGFSLDHSQPDELIHPHHLLELGWMGGPQSSQTKFVPDSHFDRWGEEL